MIIPSIDLMNGRAVQLVGGEEMAIDAGDPRPIAEKFALAGEIAVVDLDAALGQGSNADVIKDLIAIAPCRVGGGVRTVGAALDWLDAGATQVVLGTAATPEVLAELPRERVIAALDARHGEVVVEGWRKAAGFTVADRMAELKDLVGGFLVTFVEREGRMGGLPTDEIARLAAIAGDARLTVAGGVRDAADVAAADRAGADAQVGMALYSGALDLADAITAPLVSDRPDGLWPTIVADERDAVLGLVYSNAESVREAVRTGRGVYRSRSRGALWRKGETSGATQALKRIALDCDRDALKFTVRQEGAGFCHLNTRTCFGADAGIDALARRLAERAHDAPAGSYTRTLLDDPALLRAKLLEEADELADAKTKDEVAWEAADVLYFTLVAMARAGVALDDVARELDRRARAVRRRSQAEAVT